MTELTIIGGGLAGCEAAWQAASRNIKVTLYEMRNDQNTSFAHKTDFLCELVCSNSFRSDDNETTAIGLLHQEMRLLNSLIMQIADQNQVPAGSALAVDRDEFAKQVQKHIYSHPNIKIIRQEITDIETLGEKSIIIATGPLTSDKLSQSIAKITGVEYLAFFDAIAPIIYRDSINFDVAWFQSRYDKQGPFGNGKDYINCPLNKEQYYAFIEALITGDKTDFKEWEKSTPYFNGCLPIEVMAERGKDTLRFGPMKPVGLTDPNNKEKPYAVVQLRQDNKTGSLYNIVGFQTKLKYSEQTRIFKTIPGLDNAEFARLGGIHRNSFINSPKLIDCYLRLRSKKNIRFAGQITGVEGYVESAACGLIAGIFAAEELHGISFKDQTKYDDDNNKLLPPKTSAIGSLLNYITSDSCADFQPMNVNFGLMPDLIGKNKKDARKNLFCSRAKADFVEWLALNDLAKPNIC